MKKIILFILVTSLFVINLFGFDKQNQVLTGLRNGSYDEVKTLLQQWEKENPSDPDMMTNWFNYFLFRKAEQKDIVGYMKNGQYGMYTKTVYNEGDFKTAISYLDKALKKNPYRMDIYFGKINAYLSAEKYSEATVAISDFLKVYDKNKKEWYWSNNKKFSDNNWNVEEVVLSALQDYCQMYDYYQDGDSAKKALDQILQRFPKNVIFLNYLSYYYSAGKNYDKAIEVLLSAHKIDPNDYVIVGNLASDYEKIGNYKEAEKWYSVMSKMNSEEAKEFGAEGLKRLKNRK